MHARQIHPSRCWVALLLFLCALPSHAGGQQTDRGAPTIEHGPKLSASFARTELFFGSAKPDGGAVTEAEWRAFLDEEITPRFPDGLTVLAGIGQFRETDGRITQETARVLILLYPRQASAASSEKIEAIRRKFKQRFQQSSVLRTDRCCERVGF